VAGLSPPLSVSNSNTTSSVFAEFDIGGLVCRTIVSIVSLAKPVEGENNWDNCSTMTDVDIRSTYALYRPSVATVKQRFQIAFFLLFNCLNNLGINLSVVSRAVNRTEVVMIRVSHHGTTDRPERFCHQDQLSLE